MKAGAEMQKAAAAGAKQNPKSFSNEQYDGFNEYLTQTVAGLTTTGELIDSVTKELGGYVSDLNAVPTAAKDAATKKAVAEAKGKDYQEKAAKAAETKDPADVAAAQKAVKKHRKLWRKLRKPERHFRLQWVRLLQLQMTAPNTATLTLHSRYS